MDAGRVIELLERVVANDHHARQCLDYTLGRCDCGAAEVERDAEVMLAELRAEAQAVVQRRALQRVVRARREPAVAIDPSALDRAVGPSDGEKPCEPLLYYPCHHEAHRHGTSTAAITCMQLPEASK